MHIPTPGIASAARLIHLRVALAGCGAFRQRALGSRTLIDAVLPGSGSIVRMQVEYGVKHEAQLFYANGRPLSGPMDVRGGMAFASFMHNVDCEIMRAAAHGIPADVLHFADAAAASADPPLQAAVELLLQETQLDFPDATSPWRPSSEAMALLEAASRSSEVALARAATAVLDVASGAKPPKAFSDADSLVRWHEQVDRWICTDAQLAPETHPAGELTWVRLETHAAIVAEARRMGQLEGDFLDGVSEAARREDIRARLEQLRKAWAEHTGLAGLPADEVFVEGRAFYSLRDAAGRRIALAVVKDGEIGLRGPRGREGETFIASLDALSHLRTGLGLVDGCAGPRLS